MKKVTRHEHSTSEKKAVEKKAFKKKQNGSFTSNMIDDGLSFVDHGQFAGNETNSDLAHLDSLCKQLGIGSSGLLSQPEFKRLSAYIALNNTRDKELTELFSKLDTDSDGLVSLSEIIAGLPRQSVLHAPVPASPHQRSSSCLIPRSPRPSSHPRARVEEMSTPNTKRALTQFISGDVSGIFSSIDYSLEGIAQSEDVIDLWFNLGVGNGAEILSSLGFNPNGRIKLCDLMSALETRMADPNVPDEIFNAAIASFHQEVYHLKSKVEELQSENRKLKLDLAESKAHSSLLAREMDERHLQLDSSWESKLLETIGNLKDTYWTVENKYQEQVKMLQNTLVKEKKLHATQVTELETDLQELKNQSHVAEKKWNEKSADFQKEIRKLSGELQTSNQKIEYQNKQIEDLKMNLRDRTEKMLNKTSPDVEELQAKLDLNQHFLDISNKEIKKLKDDNDELLTELERLKTAQRKKEQALSGDTERMSQKPVYQALSPPALYEPKVEERITPLSLAQTSQPLKVKDMMSHSQTESYEEPVHYSNEMRQHQDWLERELKDTRHKYEMELYVIQDIHKAEIKTLNKSFEEEKRRLYEEYALPREKALEELERKMSDAFARERKDLLDKADVEKRQLIDRHRTERENLEQKLISLELEVQHRHKDKDLIQHLEVQLSQCREDLQMQENQKTNLVQLMKKKEESLMLEFDHEKKNLVQNFTQQLEQCQLAYNQHLGNILAGGVKGLSGQLKDDFMMMVQRDVDVNVRESDKILLQQLQIDRRAVALELEKERHLIYKEGEAAKNELIEKYEAYIAALTSEVTLLHSQRESEQLLYNDFFNKVASERGDREVYDKLREIEAELRHERIKQNKVFEAKMKEIELQKQNLQEEKIHKLIEENQKKEEEINLLKARVQTLKQVKKDLKRTLEEMNKRVLVDESNVSRTVHVLPVQVSRRHEMIYPKMEVSWRKTIWGFCLYSFCDT
uniref:EF-hand domain-containing protein n=1 Tax=Biomphalaria glabrata TaxID=6526 RepID=A0A2C9LRE4_BIOGL